MPNIGAIIAHIEKEKRERRKREREEERRVPLSPIRLTISCRDCGSTNVHTGAHGMHCHDCGSYNLNYGSY